MLSISIYRLLINDKTTTESVVADIKSLVLGVLKGGVLKIVQRNSIIIWSHRRNVQNIETVDLR